MSQRKPRSAGLQIHLGYTDERFFGDYLSFCQDRPPEALFLTDNFGDEAGMVFEAERKLPDTEIFVRIFKENPADKTGDNHQQFMSPAQSAANYAPYRGTRIRTVHNNEPDFVSSINWHIEVMKQCRANGLRASIGGYSVGTPEPHLIPQARPMLEYMARYPDLFNLDLHAYGRALLSHEFNKELRNPDQWPLQYGGWLLGRFHDWLDYCEVAEIPAPNIMIGEYGFDVIREITDYGNVGGVNTLHDLWRGWGYGDPAAYAASQLRNGYRVFFAHVPQIIGAAIFQLSTFLGNWPLHNILGTRGLFELLDRGFENTAMSYQGYRVGTYTLEGAGGVRIRSNPSAAAPIVRTVPLGGQVVIKSQDVNTSGGYGWQQTEDGYMALFGGADVTWRLEPVVTGPEPVDREKIKQEIIDRVKLL